MKKRRVGDGVEDRLSSLSDEILVDILRLLPFDEAVATSVLSKCWRYLWTQHTSIVIPVHKFIPGILFQLPKHKRPKYILNTIPTVSHILGRLTSPYLTSLEIYGPDPAHSKAEYDAISSCFEHWLGLICGHNIQVINLRVVHLSLREKLFVWLPSCIFQTKSLVKLVLKNVNYNCRLPSVITLPNLKHLELDLGCLDDFHRRLLGNLSESFPLLQILCLNFYWTDGLYLINLSSPSLHSLSVLIWNFLEVLQEPLKIVIDAPNLDYIKIGGKHEGSFEFVSNPIALATAVIDIYGKSCDKMLGLIKGISYARSLVVNNNCDFIDALIFWEDNGSLPLFGKLVELHIVIFEGNYRWVCGFPVAMLAKVKKIQIEFRDGIKKALKLLNRILSSSSVLELLFVSLTLCDEITQEEGRKICEAILMLERSSKNCRIQFTGDYSTESNSTSEIRDLVFETAV